MANALIAEYLPSTIVGCTAIGIGFIFYSIEQRSSTTLVLSLSYVFVGLALMLNPPFVDRLSGPDVPLLPRLMGVFEAGAVFCFALWLGKVAATAQASAAARRCVAIAVRSLQVLGVAYFVLGFVFPLERLNDYIFSAGEPGVLARPGFWMFGAVYLLIFAAFLVAWITLAFQRLDAAERARAVATVIGTPFAVATTLLPRGIGELSLTLALLIWLVGFFRYFVIQGERGVFMSRFLSPAVSELVRMKGMAAVMQPQTLDITAICCDLRGFTACAAARSSSEVIELLNEYYAAVGQEVAAFQGTVKDYAGDGILVLVGAPLARADHAQAGLALARRMLDAGRRVAQKWSTASHPLGCGVGVASGRASVGAIGASSRMEYSAVGTVVNLASRLCQVAADGEILADEAVGQQAGAAARARGTQRFKGIPGDVPVFELAG